MESSVPRDHRIMASKHGPLMTCGTNDDKSRSRAGTTHEGTNHASRSSVFGAAVAATTAPPPPPSEGIGGDKEGVVVVPIWPKN